MGFFSRLFGKKKKETPKPETNDKNNHLAKSIEEIESAIKGLGFVSQKEYLDILEKYRHLKDQITAVKNAGMLEEYCAKNNVTGSDIDLFLSFFNSSSYRDKHNEEFIIREKAENKDYLEHILDDCDPHIRLDDEQIKVVISDEDNTLVIAGAGAGKTTTVAAKVKYLVDKKRIDPKEILVISFTNKAVDELKERINQKLKIAAKINAFFGVILLVETLVAIALGTSEHPFTNITAELLNKSDWLWFDDPLTLDRAKHELIEGKDMTLLFARDKETITVVVTPEDIK